MALNARAFRPSRNVFAGENALDNQLFSAVRRHHHYRAADDSHPNIEGPAEQEFGERNRQAVAAAFSQ